MSEHTEAQWNAAISAALRADDIKAVPGLLVLMALDGYGHEAESLRRLMLTAPAPVPDPTSRRREVDGEEKR